MLVPIMHYDAYGSMHAMQTLSLLTNVFLVHANWNQRLSKSQMQDRSLVYTSVVPITNIVRAVCMPSFNVTQRHWPTSQAISMAAVMWAADFPLVYVVAQWMLSTPLLM